MLDYFEGFSKQSNEQQEVDYKFMFLSKKWKTVAISSFVRTSFTAFFLNTSTPKTTITKRKKKKFSGENERILTSLGKV